MRILRPVLGSFPRTNSSESSVFFVRAQVQRKMTSQISSVGSSASGVRPRAAAWTAAMECRLAEVCLSHLEAIEGTADVPNIKHNRTSAWEAIKAELSAEFGGSYPLTVDRCQRKWWSLKSDTKKKFVANKAEMNRTGSGEALLQRLSEAERLVHEAYSTTPAFCGEPHGLSTSVMAGRVSPRSINSPSSVSGSLDDAAGLLFDEYTLTSTSFDPPSSSSASLPTTPALASVPALPATMSTSSPGHTLVAPPPRGMGGLPPPFRSPQPLVLPRTTTDSGGGGVQRRKRKRPASDQGQEAELKHLASKVLCKLDALLERVIQLLPESEAIPTGGPGSNVGPS
eukprot:GHVU01060296.1.p2 GENE.GHVU01060296.1~~GHVU01060296.1.p2  ORF type:complete len:341 (+),score=32.13 GHVU01060296.1:438-1460(+)